MDQIGLGRNAIAGLVIARLNTTTHNFENLPVFGTAGAAELTFLRLRVATGITISPGAATSHPESAIIYQK